MSSSSSSSSSNSNLPKLARRGFLMGATMVAVVGFDPVHRTWVSEARAGLAHLPHLDGELVTDAASLAAAAEDFGHYIHRSPVAVLRPGSTRDVVQMVRYCKRHRIKIAMRGQGHATHGQAQVEAGVVIDSATLSDVGSVQSDGTVSVGPGARWRQVIAATLPLNFTPPTLPNYLDLTVGGNIAGGGIGGAAHQHGAVVDNVLELDVVTGEGDLRVCSAHRNAALFNSVLAGLGQFGIVVRARIRLVPAKQLVRLFTVQYPDVGAFLDDARTAALDGRFDHIEAQVNADATGHYGTVTMFAVKYFNPSSPPNNGALLAGLDFTGVDTADLPYAAFLARLDPIVDFLKAVGAWTIPHPWFDVLLPNSTAETFVAETIADVTTAETGNGNLLLYPLRRSKFKRPLLRVPDHDGDDVFFLYDVLSFAPPVPPLVDIAVARNTEWNTRARELGGKRYNIGSANLSPEDWRKYFSPLYPAVVLAKLAFDPANILTPGQGIFPHSGCDD